MKLATFNINNVNKRLPNLLAWLERAAPDIVCLQELKATDREFPVAALRDAGYGALWSGESRWNGVAVLARGAPPIATRRELPGDDGDSQRRYLECAALGVIVGCLYAPNGNPQPGPKLTYKLAWLERLRTHAAALYASGHPVVLAGDYNVVPTDADIYSTRSWKKNALLHPDARTAYARLLAQGWVDALAERGPADQRFTFWDYFRDHWARDAGLRIDHLLLSASVAPRLRAAGVDRWVRGEDGASDHAPAWIELAD